MADIDNLLARRSAVYAELAAMTSAANGGKPTYTINGQSVQHTEYKKGLYDELDMLNKQINIIQGPFELQGQAIT